MSPRPPSRTAGEENFPVGSLLIATELRPAVARFYRVARTADDIADDPNLSAEEKLARLDRVEAELDRHPDRAATGHLRQLLKAFRRDAVERRCADWDALAEYCADSANPVGRFLLDLHGEDPAGYPASDALCTALQVLNHLQDCGDDYRALDRIYLPSDWLAQEAVAETALAGGRTTPALRRVIDRCLAEVDDLLAAAAPLPLRLRSTRLALEAAAILALARALAERLKRRDPLAGRVQLSRPAMLAVGLSAAAACLWRRLFVPRSHGRRHPA